MEDVLSVLKGSYTELQMESVVLDIPRGTGLTIDESTVALCDDFMRGLQGDLTSLFKTADVLANDNSHIRSFLATLLTGQTMYDHLPDFDPKRRQGVNSLLREAFKVFEAAAREEFKGGAANSIQAAFEQRVPLYLLMLLTKDKDTLDNFFNFNA